MGLESGLFCVEDSFYDVCVCSVYDGERHQLGFSCAWQLPPSLLSAIQSGEDMVVSFLFRGHNSERIQPEHRFDNLDYLPSPTLFCIFLNKKSIPIQVFLMTTPQNKHV